MCVNYYVSDKYGFGYASFSKGGMKVDIPFGCYSFSIEVVYWFIIWDHGVFWKLVFFIYFSSRVYVMALVN